MISSVTLMLAALAVGSNANVIPYGGILPYTISGTPITYSVAPSYSVHPVTYKVDVPSPVVTSHIVAAAPPPAVVSATQYAAVASPIISAAPVQSQFHAQDEFGGYHFGHAGGPSSRNEVRDHFGNVQGSYNYIDSNGDIQTAHYTAGREGFQVAASNLPVAPAADPAAALVPVEDTPEVKAAKSAFKSAFDKAVAANEAAAVPAVAPEPVPEVAEPVAVDAAVDESSAPIAARRKRSTTPVVAIHGTPYHYPYSFGYPFPSPYSVLPTVYNAAVPQHVAPLTYSVAAPGAALRNAELLRVTNNPNHATSYRVL